MLVVYLNLINIIIGWVNCNISQECLECLCEIESQCKPLPCAMDINSLSCGHYQIKEAYWIDCGKLGNSWEECALNKECAEECIRNYMKRYGKFCMKSNDISCVNYGRIHNGGPYGCRHSYTENYGDKIQRCLERLESRKNFIHYSNEKPIVHSRSVNYGSNEHNRNQNFQDNRLLSKNAIVNDIIRCITNLKGILSEYTTKLNKFSKLFN
ncbi:hypothetical protein SNEBB_002787 [Seison nebaliae]|nr:hypothetical protein SNEBB_002787 [Seison nebaliae]